MQTPLSPTPISRVVVRLVGIPMLVPGERATVQLERHDAALLAMLAIEGPGARAELAARLWPETLTGDPGVNLRQRLAKLRRACAAPVIVGKPTLSLAEGVEHDLWPLLQPPSEPAEWPDGELLGALDYRGTGSLQSWVNVARERWRSARRGVLQAKLADLQARGLHEGALDVATRWLLSEPGAELAHWWVVHLHYTRGDRASARAAIDSCRATLRHDGREPGRRMAELAALVERMSEVPQRAAQSVPQALLHPPRTVGRHAVLEELRDAWRQRLVVVLDGEAGIGKSRVVHDLAGSHASSVICRARPGDGLESFKALALLMAELVRRFPCELPAETAAEIGRWVPAVAPASTAPFVVARLLDAADVLFRAAVVGGWREAIVDDCHWADPASLDALLTLCRRLSDTELNWLFSARNRAGIPQLERWTQEHAEAVHTLSLAVLDACDVEALVCSLGLPGMGEAAAVAWARRLAAHAAGSPLHVLEYLMAAQREYGVEIFARATPPADLRAPASLLQLFDQRVAALSDDARALARVAALAGSQLSPDLAARALGRTAAVEVADAWAELEAKGVFSKERADFRHDLIRERLRDKMPAAIARAAHAKLAAAAETLSLPPTHVAEHWELAGEPALAARWYGSAAQLAFRENRRADERACWDQAARCFDDEGDGEGSFDARYGAFMAALPTLTLPELEPRAEELERRARGDRQLQDAALAWFQVHANRRDAQRALDASARALEACNRRIGEHPAGLGDYRDVCAYLYRCTALGLAGRIEEALGLLARVEATIRASGDLRWAMDLDQTLGYLQAHAGRLLEAESAYGRAAHGAEALQDLSAMRVSYNWLAQVLARRGALERAARAARACERAHELMGDTDSMALTIVRTTRGLLDIRLGRFASGMDLLDAARTTFQQAKAAQAETTCREHLARAYLWLGQPGTARFVLGRWPDELTQGVIPRRLLELELARAEGQDTRDALQALESTARSAPFVERAAWLLAMAGASLPAVALALAEEADQLIGPAGLESLMLHSLAVQAQALAALDRPEPAKQRVQAALALLAAFRPTSLYVGDLYRAAASVLIAGRDDEAADRVLRDAVHWVCQVALPNVPARLQLAFLRDNAANRWLLETARSRAVPTDSAGPAGRDPAAPLPSPLQFPTDL